MTRCSHDISTGQSSSRRIATPVSEVAFGCHSDLSPPQVRAEAAACSLARPVSQQDLSAAWVSGAGQKPPRGLYTTLVREHGAGPAPLPIHRLVSKTPTSFTPSSGSRLHGSLPARASRGTPRRGTGPTQRQLWAPCGEATPRACVRSVPKAGAGAVQPVSLVSSSPLKMGIVGTALDYQ